MRKNRGILQTHICSDIDKFCLFIWLFRFVRFFRKKIRGKTAKFMYHVHHMGLICWQIKRFKCVTANSGKRIRNFACLMYFYKFKSFSSFLWIAVRSLIESHISSQRINRIKIHNFHVWKSERHPFIWTVAKRWCDIKRNHIKMFSNSFLYCDDKFTVKFVWERTLFVENVKILIEATMRMKEFDSRECSTGHEKPVLNNSSQK